MRVRRRTVQNFRGIERCDWNVEPRLVALVGAGDATKTTLLDALGLVLSPSYSPAASHWADPTTSRSPIEVAGDGSDQLTSVLCRLPASPRTQPPSSLADAAREYSKLIKTSGH